MATITEWNWAGMQGVSMTESGYDCDSDLSDFDQEYYFS